MRDRRRRRPRYTPRLAETPEGVRQVATSVHQQLGREKYEAPFEVASVLRAYGVRVISALGDRATEALQELAQHRDFRVRATVADELGRHRDVSSIRLLSGLAANDENPDVQKAAVDAVEELRQVAEQIAAEQRAEEAQTADSEPQAAATLLVSGEDVSGEDASPDAGAHPDDGQPPTDQRGSRG